MLKKQPHATFKATVNIPIVGVPSVPLEVEYRYMKTSEIINFYNRLHEFESNKDKLLAILIGWNGYEEEYSEAALDEMMESYPFAANAIFETFHQEVTGAARKN